VTADPWPDLPDFDPMTGPEPAAGWLTSPGHPAAGADLRTLPPRGRAKRAGAINSGRPGWCYLLHFAEPIGADRPRVAQAQHYVGWAARGRVAARVGDDLAGAPWSGTRSASASAPSWSGCGPATGTGSGS
jgi:hypothetical protein